MKHIIILLHVAVLSLLVSCNQSNKQKESKMEGFVLKHPEWLKDANIYEVNVRQYTPEGTLNAFSEHLPRLKEMGVDIIWLMPINPIGVKNKKGEMGSFYAIRDYKTVNADFGTLDDFKALVNKTHELGMKIILDWVANHTSWDNALIEEHRDWYMQDSLGNIISPNDDWTDVADLNYDNMELQEYMIGALKYWIEECDIDGYRCDMAGLVPTSFWEKARPEIEKLKHMFMLAEWEGPELQHKAFDMTYGWELHHLLNDIARGEKQAGEIHHYFDKIEKEHGKDDIILHFTSNHDENAWQGSALERMGDAAEIMAILTFTVPGMPLVYSGQEAGLNRKLKFFEKDEIEWDNYSWSNFYKSLFDLKRKNKALWSGEAGGSFTRMGLDNNNIFAFTRNKEENEMLVILNLSNNDQEFNSTGFISETPYENAITGESYSIKEEKHKLGAWEYLVLQKK